MKEIKLCGRDARMTDREEMTLNPLEKWVKFKVFPLQVTLNLLAFLAVFVLIIVFEKEITTSYRNSGLAFSGLFITENKKEIYHMEHLLNGLNDTVYNYYNLYSISTKHYVHLPFDKLGTNSLDFNTSFIPPLILNLKFQQQEQPIKYELDLNFPYGPFGNLNPYQYSDYTDRIEYLEIVFYLLDVASNEPDDYPYKSFEIKITYTNTQGFLIKSQSFSQIYNQTPYISFGSILNLMVVILCGFSMLGSIARFGRTYAIRNRTIRRFNSIPKDRLKSRFKGMGVPGITKWSKIPRGIRWVFFSPWALYSILGDVLLITGSCLALIPQFRVPGTIIERSLFGIGVLIVTTRLLEYFEFFARFYTLILTLKYSIGGIFRYTLSVLPIFVGFSMTGSLMFGPYSSNFSSLGTSLVTLFSLMNGDDVHNLFLDLEENYPIGIMIPRIYLFLFIILAIAAVLNVFIFIIEDAFLLAKLVSVKYHKDYEGIPGTTVSMYRTQWLAIQHVLDVEKLFLVLDAESFQNSFEKEKEGPPRGPHLYTPLPQDITEGVPPQNGRGSEETIDTSWLMTPQIKYLDSLRRGAEISAENHRINSNLEMRHLSLPAARVPSKGVVGRGDKSQDPQLLIKGKKKKISTK